MEQFLTQLYRIAKECRDPMTRLRAVNRLTNADWLWEIKQSDPDEDVRKAARERRVAL